MPMRDVFKGTAELKEAVTRVGWIAITHARVDDALNYLIWQVEAFEQAHRVRSAKLSAAQLQEKLREMRKSGFDQPVKHRLTRMDKAINHPRLTKRLAEIPDGKRFVEQWDGLKTKIADLSEQRNEAIHSAISWSGGGVVRTVGKFFETENSPINPAMDQKLIGDLSELALALGLFASELGTILPFASDDRIFTVPPAIIDLTTPPRSA